MEPIGFTRHDHATCIADTVAAVSERCQAEGLQFTPIRRRVLELLLDGHRALGAYEILDLLRAEGMNSQPPVAYRALEFLTRHGFAHRIERLNAFIACAHPDHSHAPAFLICRNCRAVAELLSGEWRTAMEAAARASGFTPERASVEIEGLCPACRGTGTATA